MTTDTELIRKLLDTPTKSKTFAQCTYADGYSRWRLGQPEDALGLQLREYQEDLCQKGLAPRSVNSIVSTVRSDLRRRLYDVAEDAALDHARKLDLEDLASLLRSLEPHEVPAIPLDDIENDTFRLRDKDHVTELVFHPKLADASDSRRLRDRPLIFGLFGFGLSAIELSALDVSDFDYEDHNTWELRVPDKPGCAARTIRPSRLPEPFQWAAEMIVAWQSYHGITEGPLFRGFYRGDETIRPERLSPRSVERILREYSIVVDGQERALKPLDLRRAHAFSLYLDGWSVQEIQAHLKLALPQTVLEYIGTDETAIYNAGYGIPFELDLLKHPIYADLAWHTQGDSDTDISDERPSDDFDTTAAHWVDIPDVPF